MNCTSQRIVSAALARDLDSLIDPLVSRWFGIDLTGDRLVFEKTVHLPDTRRRNTVAVVVRPLDQCGEYYIMIDGSEWDGSIYIHALWDEIRLSPFVVAHESLDDGDGVVLQVSQTGDDGQHICWLHG